MSKKAKSPVTTEIIEPKPGSLLREIVHTVEVKAVAKPQTATTEPRVILAYRSMQRRKTQIVSPRGGQYVLVRDGASQPLTLLQAFKTFVLLDDPTSEDCFSVGVPDLDAAQEMFNTVAEFAAKGGAR